jgi:hypothetical protein
MLLRVTVTHICVTSSLEVEPLGQALLKTAPKSPMKVYTHTSHTYLIHHGTQLYL